MSERLRIGEGQVSGYLSISLGLISLGGVICFHFPEYFTTAEFRSLYPTEMLRWLLLLCLILAFGFALLSFLLGTSSKLAFTGVMITALAVVLGGHTVEIDEFEQSLYSISLDWLLIDIVVLSAIFVPIELFLPKRESQTKFHEEWRTDLVYFAISHLLVQLTAVIIKTPAEFIFRDWGLNDVQSVVSGWPFLIQVFVAILVADLCQYTIHRAFHRLPYLWRVHSVHHSIWAVDWIAGSRLHLVDILITR
ncbi:MAG TPA: sterol desaturase, partial [Gammaproteobacteria bacterium]|nr:sterol desaturase [Gammaproteobacteria bacterium]